MPINQCNWLHFNSNQILGLCQYAMNMTGWLTQILVPKMIGSPCVFGAKNTRRDVLNCMPGWIRGFTMQFFFCVFLNCIFFDTFLKLRFEFSAKGNSFTKLFFPSFVRFSKCWTWQFFFFDFSFPQYYFCLATNTGLTEIPDVKLFLHKPKNPLPWTLS